MEGISRNVHQAATPPGTVPNRYVESQLRQPSSSEPLGVSLLKGDAEGEGNEVLSEEERVRNSLFAYL